MNAQEPELEGLGDIPDPVRPLRALPPPPSIANVASPTRAARARRNIALFGAAIVVASAIVLRGGIRADLLDGFVIFQLGTWMLVIAFAARVVVIPAERGLPSGLRALQVGLLALVLVFSALALAPAVSGFEWHSFLGCALFGASVALAPLAAAALALRRSFLSAPGWRGAVIGAACGLGGTIGVHAHCPRQSSAHVLLSHGTPIVLGALAGSVLGRVRGRA
jgi:hypothetical protein